MNEQSSLPRTPHTRTNAFFVAAIIVSFVSGSFGGVVSAMMYSKSMQQPASVVAETSTSGVAVATTTAPEETLLTQVVSTAKSSVVSIVITKDVAKAQTRSMFYDPFAEENSADDNSSQAVEICSGTGFVVSDDGMILTNKHVICDTEATYSVVFSDGSSQEATVLATDPLSDIAILKIAATNLKPLSLGDSSVLEQGQTVIAIGNALGEFENTVTKGVVSGLNRDLGGNYTDLIQTDAAINEGNSGGPLLNLEGAVIGINTAIRRDSMAEGLGFAIPINEAKIAIESVKTEGRVVRPALGVRYQPITKAFAAENAIPYEYGAYITGNGTTTVGVIPGGSADKAGLKDGDIILSIDGVKVDVTHTLASMVKMHAIGDVLTVRVYQDGAEKDFAVTLLAMPELK